MHQPVCLDRGMLPANVTSSWIDTYLWRQKHSSVFLLDVYAACVVKAVNNTTCYPKDRGLFLHGSSAFPPQVVYNASLKVMLIKT